MEAHEEIEPTLNDMLVSIAKQSKDGMGLDLLEYYPLLDWANVFTLVPPEMEPNKGALAFELDGNPYLLIFLSKERANEISRQCGEYKIRPERGRDVMAKVRAGSGLVVDWGGDSEVRITPEKVIELNEYFSVWKVKQETTDDWLLETLRDLPEHDLTAEQKISAISNLWRSTNGFPVLSGSRRSRRISQFAASYDPSDPNGQSRRLEEIWTREYAENRYLHHLSQENLDQRLRAILTNMLYLDRGTLPHELSALEWREHLRHVREEYCQRGISSQSIEAAFSAVELWPRLKLAANEYQEYDGPPGQLFRFCMERYLRPFLQDGKLTLFPASRYISSELLASQRDDELSRTRFIDGTTGKRMHHMDKEGNRHPIKTVGSITLSNNLRTDYYSWFTSTTFDPRLFDDFQKDACLVIHDFDTFSERLLAGVERALGDWHGACSLIRYYDPLNADSELLNHGTKDFRFTYQREYRFTWFPSKRAATNLPQLDVSLGPMGDVASLICLE